MTAALTTDELFGRFLDNHDVEDLGLVFDRAVPELMAQARRAKLDPTACEDVIQETFLVVIRRASEFSVGQAFMPWAQGILAKQILAERRRSLKRRQALGLGDAPLDADGDPDGDPGPREVVEEKELRAQVRTALTQLSESHRDIVEGALLEGMSVADLAPRVGISANAVAVRLHRGLRRLRQLLPSTAMLGVAGLLVRPARGPEALRSALQSAVREGAVAVGARAWWASPPALATASVACLAAVAVVAGLTMGNGGSGGEEAPADGEVIELGRSTEAALESSVVEPGAQESDSAGRTAAVAESAEAEGTSAAKAAAGSRLQFVDPSGRPIGSGIEVYYLKTTPRVELPDRPMTPMGVTDTYGTVLAPSAESVGDETPAVYARGDGLAAVTYVDLKALGEPGGTPDDRADDRAGERSAFGIETVEMMPSVPLSIEVVDDTGAPVGGAQFAALSLIDAIFSMGHEEALERGSFSPRGYRHLFGGVTDELGKGVVDGYLTVIMDDLAIGSVMAWKPGYASFTQRFQVEPSTPSVVQLVLPRLNSLRLDGVALDETGVPISDVDVVIQYAGNAEIANPHLTTTSPDGRWAVPSEMLERFPLELAFDRRGYVRSTLRFATPDKLPTGLAEVKMSAARVLEGRVTDGSGRAVPSVIHVVSLGRLTTRPTDEEGRFSFEGLDGQPCLVQVVAREPRFGMATLSVDEFEGPCDVSLVPPTSLARRVEFRAVDPRAGGPVAVEALALIRREPADGAWPFIECDEGVAIARDVPAGARTLFALAGEDRAVVVQELTLPAGEEIHEVLVQVQDLGALELVVTGTVGLAVTGGQLMASRRLGPELPMWARLSSEYANHEYDRELEPAGPTEVTALVAGPWDAFVHGDGWAVEPLRFEAVPGARTRLDLEAVPAGAVRFEMPAVMGPGCFTLELRRGDDASAEWTKVAVELFSGPNARTRRIHLPPGLWQWRATCSLISDTEVCLRGLPRATGEVEVVVGEVQVISIGR